MSVPTEAELETLFTASGAPLALIVEACIAEFDGEKFAVFRMFDADGKTVIKRGRLGDDLSLALPIDAALLKRIERLGKARCGT